jgi:hypothetical protein
MFQRRTKEYSKEEPENVIQRMLSRECYPENVTRILS